MAEKRKTDWWLVWLYGILLLAGLTIVVLGLFQYKDGLGTNTLLWGAVAVMIPAATYPIAAALTALLSREGGDRKTHETLASINDRLLVSDAAKRIAYREQDRNALRQAIRDDVAKKDYDAALVLVDEMSQVYGYRQEAEQFREEILTARRAVTEDKITAGINQLDDVIARFEWDRALALAQKMQRVFTGSPRVAGLEKRVADAKERHKHELERKFLGAAERDDIETAMDLLKELDRYLSTDEAEPFRETARGVIGKKRLNLGVQFKLAVHDKEWTNAVRIGEQIIKDFPNTKMADEVRGMLDKIRDLASKQESVGSRISASSV